MGGVHNTCAGHPTNLLSVILTLDGINSRTRPSLEEYIKLGVLAKPARVAEKRVFLVVVNGSTLVALVDVLTARATHPRVGGHGGLAPWTLENL